MEKLPKTMRGVALVGHGGPEMLEMRNDLAVPIPDAGEVLIRVFAAGVNNTDINTRTGWYAKDNQKGEDVGWSGQGFQFPRIQGADVCGEIVSVGEGVDPNRVGDRVIIEPCIVEVGGQPLNPPWYFGSECDGGFAEYTKVAARHAYTIDSQLTDVELASFPCSYSTAENLLTRSTVVAGESVLVTGASGGVGSAVIQLAKARGAQVIAVTSPSKSQTLLDIGADRTVNRGENLVKSIGINNIDVVIDLVAGPQWSELLDILKPGGRYAVSGAIGGAQVELDVRTLYLKDLSFFGCTVLEPEVFGNLVSRIESGQIKPLVAETYALDQIAEAQTSFEKKNHVGKIVLDVIGR